MKVNLLFNKLGTMREHWPDCIITVIDVIGIKNTAKIGNSQASSPPLSLASGE